MKNIILNEAIMKVFNEYKSQEEFTDYSNSKIDIELNKEVSENDFLKILLVDFDDFYKDTSEKFILLNEFLKQRELDSALYKMISNDSISKENIDILSKVLILENELTENYQEIIEDEQQGIINGLQSSDLMLVLEKLNMEEIIENSLKDLKLKIFNNMDNIDSLEKLNLSKGYFEKNDIKIDGLLDTMKNKIVNKAISSNSLNELVEVIDNSEIKMKDILINILPLDKQEYKSLLLDLSLLNSSKQNNLIEKCLDDFEEIKSTLENEFDIEKLKSFEKTINNMNFTFQLLNNSNDSRYVDKKFNNLSKIQKNEIKDIIELYRNSLENEIDNSIGDDNSTLDNYDTFIEKLDRVEQLSSNISKAEKAEKNKEIEIV